MDLPQLELVPDEDVNFRALYLHMAEWTAQVIGAKDAVGERLHTNACQWMDTAFSTQALKDNLVWHSDLFATHTPGRFQVVDHTLAAVETHLQT